MTKVSITISRSISSKGVRQYFTVRMCTLLLYAAHHKIAMSCYGPQTARTLQCELHVSD
jgi:hypothetical protein